MDLQLKGLKALITGASKGIGLTTAYTLGEEGVDVGICARDEENVRKAVEGLKAKGVKAIGDSVDVTNADQYAAWINSSVERLGGLDIFVHNVTASPSTPGMRGWDLAYNTDILGAVRGVETALPHLFVVADLARAAEVARMDVPLDVVIVEEVKAELRELSALQPTWDTGPDDIAFILYTSGTTKDPKGVDPHPRLHAGPSACRPSTGSTRGRATSCGARPAPAGRSRSGTSCSGHGSAGAAIVVHDGGFDAERAVRSARAARGDRALPGADRVPADGEGRRPRALRPAAASATRSPPASR